MTQLQHGHWGCASPPVCPGLLQPPSFHWGCLFPPQHPSPSEARRVFSTLLSCTDTWPRAAVPAPRSQHPQLHQCQGQSTQLGQVRFKPHPKATFPSPCRHRVPSLCVFAPNPSSQQCGEAAAGGSRKCAPACYLQTAAERLRSWSKQTNPGE